jgi:hypothetical protein
MADLPANVCPHCRVETKHALLPVSTKHGADIMCGECGGLSHFSLTRTPIDEDTLSEQERAVVKQSRELLREIKGKEQA